MKNTAQSDDFFDFSLVFSHFPLIYPFSNFKEENRPPLINSWGTCPTLNPRWRSDG